ncbi:MAG: tetratricopeptide repeat protein [Bacteroidota bacterium]
MKYILSVFLFCIFTVNALRAQPHSTQPQQTTDSLLNFIKTTKKDTLFVNALNALSGQYINAGSYQLASEYAEKAQQLARTLNYKKGIAVSFGNVGNIYLYQGNYEKAFINHQKALKIKEEIGDKQGLGNSYNNIGLIYYYQCLVLK